MDKRDRLPDRAPTMVGLALVVRPRMILGLALIVAGALFTLDNLGYVDASQYVRFWPVVLILVGLVKLAECGLVGPGCIGGGIWVVVGAALLLHNLDMVSIGELWPLLLVLLGGSIVWKATPQLSRRGPVPGRESGQTLSGTAVLGGVQRSSQSQDFRGGDFTAIMGGCEVDLRKAKISSGAAGIDTFAFMGGIEIKVPEDWQVECRGLAIMGAFECSASGPDDSDQRLVITGLAVMGGVEIKH
jgi:hypothetical protein